MKRKKLNKRKKIQILSALLASTYLLNPLHISAEEVEVVSDKVEENAQSILQEATMVIEVTKEEVQEEIKNLLAYGPYSKERIQLILIEYQDYPEELVNSALEELSINWTEQLLEEINDYLENTSQSKEVMMDRLIEDYGYTTIELEKVFDIVKPDWNKQAEKAAANSVQHPDNNILSRKGHIWNLMTFSLFTGAESTHAIDSLEVDFMENARNAARHYSSNGVPTKDYLTSRLNDDGFTSEEIEQAIQFVQITESAKEEAIATVKKIYDDLSEHQQNRLSPKSLIKDVIWQTELTYEAAEYAVNSLDINWNQMAINYVQEILANEYNNSYSKKSIMDSTYDLSFEQIQAAESWLDENVIWVDQAIKYIEYRDPSYHTEDELIDFLLEAKFTLEEAQKTVDSLNIDWDALPLAVARKILERPGGSNFSKEYFIDMLISNLNYNQETAVEVTEVLSEDYDWKVEDDVAAYLMAVSYLERNFEFSRERVIFFLQHEGYSRSSAETAVDQAAIATETDWKEVAYRRVKYGLTNGTVHSGLEISPYRKSIQRFLYNLRFTQEDYEYVIEKLASEDDYDFEKYEQENLERF